MTTKTEPYTVEVELSPALSTPVGLKRADDELSALVGDAPRTIVAWSERHLHQALRVMTVTYEVEVTPPELPKEPSKPSRGRKGKDWPPAIEVKAEGYGREANKGGK